MKETIRNFKQCIVSSITRLGLANKVRFLYASKIDSNCRFEGNNSIGEHSILSGCVLGVGTYVGRKNELSGMKIGCFCSLDSFITNATGRHPTSIFASTHPAFFSKGKAAGFTFLDKTKFKELKRNNDGYLVTIGNDVWIGDHVVLMDGVTIGDGAIIGTGAVVTKDIEPYTINVGIPAKPIKKRFTDKQIEFLLGFQWWNKDLEWIKQNAYLFENIELLMKHNEQN